MKRQPFFTFASLLFIALHNSPARSQEEIPFVPTPIEVVDRMLELAEVNERDIVYDLGSGDGRIVIRAAKKYEARGVGIGFDTIAPRCYLGAEEIFVKKARLNIYLEDPLIRKHVKTSAARHDVSVSEYCLRAITERLASEQPFPDGNLLVKAIEKARRFQKKAFAGRTFSVTSATLIAQARRERSRK